MHHSDDPIVEELHKIRDAISKASNDDMQEIAEAARARQAKSGRKVVRLPPRRTPLAEKAS